MKDIFKRPAMIREAAACSRPKKLIIEILIFLLVFTIATSIQSMFTAVPMIVSIFSSPVFAAALEQFSQTGDFVGYISSVVSVATDMPPYVVLIMLFSTVVLIAAAIMYCRLLEKRPARTMGLTRNRIFGEYALGLAVGGALFSLAVLISMVFGGFTIEGISPGASWIILLYFAGFMVQGMSEELMLRGYFMVSVSRKYSLPVAILASSLMFSLLHSLNFGVTLLSLANIFLFGAFAAIYMIKRGNIWGVAAVHTMWNFVQGNIYGIEVSGLNTGSSLFASGVRPGGELISGGDFGMEGGLCVTAALVIGIIVVSLLKNSGEKAKKACNDL